MRLHSFLALGLLLVHSMLVAGPVLSQVTDSDADGVDDAMDNCISVANPDQADSDGDGVGDSCDNCVLQANGPFAVSGQCDSQEDADGDGYGNACDADVDDDGGVSLADVMVVMRESAAVSADLKYDLDCDGGVALTDVVRALGDAVTVAPAGPSGWACAGTVPCPLGVIGPPAPSELRDVTAHSESEIRGTITPCGFASWTSSQMCSQAVWVFDPMADVESDPPLLEIAPVDGAWTATGLEPGTVYAFHPRSDAAGAHPETSVLGGPVYRATSGAPVGLPDGSLGFELAGRTGMLTDVSDAGAATIEVPLRIPPGTAGMQPELSLSYSSLAGNGTVGVGWALEGLSAIHRCGTTIGQDGFVDPADLDANDRFCWAGERLVPVEAGAYWGGDGSEYRTEIDSMAKIVAEGSLGVGDAAGPGAFTVWTADGRVLRFAEQGLHTPAGGDPAVHATAHTWALSRVEDRDGNYLTIDYHNDPVAGELWPVAIDYSGKAGASPSPPYASVELFYEPRPDPIEGFFGPAKDVVSQRLARIETRMDGAIVTSYWLGYDDVAGSRSRLARIRECGHDAAGQSHCLPATRFDWEDSETIAATWHDPPPGAPVAVWDPPMVVGDFDGSGLSGYVVRGVDVEVYASPGLSTSQSPHPAPTHVIPGALLPGSVHAGDFDGDGIDGLLSYQSAEGTVVVYDRVDTSSPIPTELRTDMMPDATHVFVEDFTGDGVDDLFLYEDWTGTVQLYPISDGRLAATPSTSLVHFHALTDPDPLDPPPAGRLHPGDFNGDGVMDLLVVGSVAGSDTDGHVHLVENGVLQQAPVGVVPNLAAWDIVTPGDFNGDGTLDILAVTLGSGSFQVHLVANGVPRAPLPPQQLPFTALGSVLAADFDGDGTDDLLTLPGLFSLATRFHPVRNGVIGPASVSLGEKAGFSDRKLIGDLTGNGLPDLLVYSPGSGASMVEVHGRAGDRITTVRDGLVGEGASAVGSRSFVYDSLTDTSLQANGLAGSGRSGSRVWAVRRVDLETPEGTRSTVYDYADAGFDPLRRESLGFGSWQATDLSTGRSRYRRFLQAHPYVGRVDLEETRIDSDQVVRAEERTWGATAIAGSPSPFVHPAETVTSRWELDAEPSGDGSPYAVQTTRVLALDAYGNPERVETASDDGWTRTVFRTFHNDPASWLIGRSGRTETTDANATEQLLETRVVEVTQRDAVTGRTLRESLEPGEPFELVTAFEYDDWGNVAAVTRDPDAVHGPPRRDETGFDARGQTVVTTRNALGHETAHQVDPRWGLASITTDPNGLVAITGFDPVGRVVSRSVSGGPATDRLYGSCEVGCDDAPGAVLKITTATSGRVPKTTFYDVLGREVRTRSPGFDGTPVEVARGFHATGEMAWSTAPYYFSDPGGETPPTTTYSYDALGRPGTVVLPNGETTTFAYDGFATTSTRSNGTELAPQATTRTVDSRGNLVGVTDALGGQTRYRYGPFDRRIHVEGPDGPETVISYQFLSKGREVITHDPDSVPTTARFDAHGQMIHESRTVDGVDQDRIRSYDELGRLRTRSEPEGVTTWQYDTAANGIGKLHRASGPHHVVTHEYDVFSRLSAVTEEIFGVAYTSGIDYDPLGRPQSLEYPSGLRIRQIYDARGHLEKLVDDEGMPLWTAGAKAADGALEAAIYGNGVTTAFARDPLTRRPTRIEAGVAGGTEVLDLELEWDELGRLARRMDENRLVAPGASFVETFTHDELDRLTSSAIGDPPNDPGFMLYSPGGRIEYKPGVGTYSYGGGDAGPGQLTSIVGVVSTTFSHDDAGNVESGMGRTATHSSYDKPTFIANASFASTLAYGLDRRRIRRVDSLGGLPMRVTRYVGRIYEETTDPSTGDVERTHFVFAQGVRTAILVEGSGGDRRVSYLHPDHLGSVAAVTDESGAVRSRYFYDAWGQAVDEAGAAHAEPERDDASGRGFTDHEHLAGLGLVHANARVLDPRVGRFTTVDPALSLRDPQDISPYSYVRGNPLALRDPSGAITLGEALRANHWGDLCSYTCRGGSGRKSSQDRFHQYPRGTPRFAGGARGGGRLGLAGVFGFPSSRVRGLAAGPAKESPGWIYEGYLAGMDTYRLAASHWLDGVGDGFYGAGKLDSGSFVYGLSASANAIVSGFGARAESVRIGRVLGAGSGFLTQRNVVMRSSLSESEPALGAAAAAGVDLGVDAALFGFVGTPRELAEAVVSDASILVFQVRVIHRQGGGIVTGVRGVAIGLGLGLGVSTIDGSAVPTRIEVGDVAHPATGP